MRKGKKGIGNEAWPPEYPKEFRACVSTYVVFGVFFGALDTLWIVALLVRGGGSCWLVVGIVTFVCGFVFYWVSRFQLQFDEYSVSYSSLFTGKKRFERSEITDADFAEVTGPFESPFTFVIRTKTGKEMRINAKVFSLDAVRELFSLVNDGEPKA